MTQLECLQIDFWGEVIYCKVIYFANMKFKLDIRIRILLANSYHSFSPRRAGDSHLNLKEDKSSATCYWDGGDCPLFLISGFWMAKSFHLVSPLVFSCNRIHNEFINMP